MYQTPKVEAREILSKFGWLAGVPDTFRRDLLQRSIVTHFAPGESVFRLGDPPGGIYGLVSGTVSISIAPAGSAPRLVLLGIPGYWTGEACFLTRMPRRGDVRAVIETTMLHTPLDALDQMAVRDPSVSHHIAQILMMSVELLLEVIHHTAGAKNLRQPSPQAHAD